MLDKRKDLLRIILFANNRIQFNQQISQMPSIQNLISDSYSEMLAAEALTLNAADNLMMVLFLKPKYHQQNILHLKWFLKLQIDHCRLWVEQVI